MEPIAELEDDEEGFDYDSPSGMDSHNDSRNMSQFRSRSNTWPQFSSLAYDELTNDPADDDTQELADKGDLTPYSPYEASYHTLAQEKSLHPLDPDANGPPLYRNHGTHLHSGSDFAVSHGELSTSTSNSTNLSSLQKASGSAASPYYSSASSGTSSFTPRASNHFSSRNDDLDTPPSDQNAGGLTNAHSHILGPGGDLSANQSEGAAAVAAASALKKNTSRRNAWGNMSYADLITQAINGSPEKRLTLSQIYEWMVQNVTYFKDKGDSNSSAGWKNSIRHNLSLHNRFMRVQNEGTGKSSWWMINPDAKPGKAARRRAISMETQNYEKRRGRVKRRVEQLRAAAGMGLDPSSLTPVSEYPGLKSSESSLLLSSSSGSSSYKLAGSTSSLHSPQTSLSNLCLSDTAGRPASALLAASPSSPGSYDPFAESPVGLVNHFHSNASSYSPGGDFRPRASSNASSTCSTVNHITVDNDNHKVSSISPHAWNTDMRLYSSEGSSYSSGIDQVGLGSGFRGSALPDLTMQLIDGVANLGTGSSHNFRLMVEDEEEMMQKTNGPNEATLTAPGAHPEMMRFGSDLASGHGASNHSYTDLYKLQSALQTGKPSTSNSPPTSSPPSSVSSKACFTSLETVSTNSTDGCTSADYFKAPSIDGASGKPVLEINNNASGGLGPGALFYDYHRYGEHHRANLAAYQQHNDSNHHHPGKMLGFMYAPESSPVGCYGAVYGASERQFSYYEYPAVSHEALSSLTYSNSHGAGDIDLDLHLESGMLECDVDQVIRHELSVDGSLDFGLGTSDTNADSTASSTPTTPTTSCSQSTFTMQLHTTERTGTAQTDAGTPAHSPASNSMDIAYSPLRTTHAGQSFYASSEAVTGTQTYPTVTSIASATGTDGDGQDHPRHSPNGSTRGGISQDSGLRTTTGNCSVSSPQHLGLQGISSASPLRPTSVLYGSYSPTHTYLTGGHYLSVGTPPSAAVVVAAAAETAGSVSVTSPMTVSGHHQPVASRSWVH